MYKIIGADQRVYGPVSADQVLRWIAEGRANGETRVQADESADWKPLALFPEFAAALAAKAQNAVPPKVGADAGERLAAEIIGRNYTLDISDCFSRSWNLLKQHFWLLFGATALILLIDAGIQSIPFLGHLAGVLLGFVLCGGLDLLFLKRLRGESVDLGVAFCGFSKMFLPLMLASLIAHLLTAVGFVLCILPGIYLFVSWWLFTPLLILDKGLDFWPALECSRKVVTKHWWTCFALTILALLVAFAGLLGCIIGIFLTVPIAVGATVYAYEDIFGGPKSPVGLSPAAVVPVPTPAVPEAPISAAPESAASPATDNPTPGHEAGSPGTPS